MKKIFTAFVIIAAAFGLSACNEQDQRLQIAQSLIQVDSQLPDVPPVSPVVLKKVVFDMPRDTARQLVKNTPACKARTDITTPDFIKTCTYYPILRKSNIFVGVDKQNFQNLNDNINALIAANAASQQRIAEVNRQRAAARGETAPAPGITVPAVVNNNVLTQ